MGLLSIKKYGQGYYTRLITAGAVGLLIMLCLNQAADSVTSTSWVANDEKTFTVDVSKSVQDTTDANGREVFKALGIGDLELVDGKLNQLKIKNNNVRTSQFQTLDLLTKINGKAITVTKEGGVKEFFNSHDEFPISNAVTLTVLRPINQDFIVRAYVLGGGAFVLGLIAFFAMNSNKAVDYMIATEAEMRKVNWPPAKEVRGSTVVVIFGTFLLVALLGLSDILFTESFQFLVSLF